MRSVNFSLSLLCLSLYAVQRRRTHQKCSEERVKQVDTCDVVGRRQHNAQQLTPVLHST